MDVANSKPVTADQLAGMSAEGRLELVRGEVVEMAPTSFEHGAIVAKLTMLMNHHATTRGLGKVVTGDVGFHLAKEPDLVRAPDIAFLTSDSIPTGLASRRFVEGAPVLVVEVVSPTDRASDIVERIDDYFGCWRKANLGCLSFASAGGRVQLTRGVPHPAARR